MIYTRAYEIYKCVGPLVISGILHVEREGLVGEYIVLANLTNHPLFAKIKLSKFL